MTFDEMQEILKNPLSYSGKQRLSAARVAIDLLDCIAIAEERKNKKLQIDASPCSCASDQGGPCSACMEAKFNL